MAGPQAVKGRVSQCIQRSVKLGVPPVFRCADVERGSNLRSSAGKPWTNPLLKDRAVGKRSGKRDMWVFGSEIK